MNVYKFSTSSSLETLQQNRRHSMFFQSVNLGEMVMCLEDLINYFTQPEDDMGLYTTLLSNIKKKQTFSLKKIYYRI